MANEENLRPIALSHEEATRNGKKGGEASAKARGERKSMRKLIEAYDRRPLSKKENAELVALGLNKDDRTAKMLRTLALIKKAEEGDVSANKLILELSREIGVNADLGNSEKVDEIVVRFEDASGDMEDEDE